MDDFDRDVLKQLLAILDRAEKRDKLYNMLYSERRHEPGCPEGSDWSDEEEEVRQRAAPWRVCDPRTWSTSGVVVMVTVCWTLVVFNLIFAMAIVIDEGRCGSGADVGNPTQITESNKTSEFKGQGRPQGQSEGQERGTGHRAGRRKRSLGDRCSSDPCFNGGTCFVNENLLLECKCPGSYSGRYCQYDLCTPNPCVNGGSCTVTIDGDMVCECAEGYKGTYCHRPVAPDYCSANPCMYNGTCTNDLVNYTYNCTCHHGFQGRNCAERKDFCSPNPCLHGGRCFWSPDGADCVCPKGQEGATCTEGFDFCASTPCLHGGTCTAIRNVGPSCECTGTGYHGKYCEQDIDECASNPCGELNFCYDEILQYRCICHPYYTGPKCLTERDLCAENNARVCGIHGDCIKTGLETYECACHKGWAGFNCELDYTNIACQYEPCPASSPCTDTHDGGRGYECDHCASNPCFDAKGVNCVSDTDTGWRCECPKTRLGTTCEKEVLTDLHLTPDGDTCKEVSGDSDGVFVIHPDKSRQPFRAFCDVTDGFTLVWNSDVIEPTTLVPSEPLTYGSEGGVESSDEAYVDDTKKFNLLVLLHAPLTIESGVIRRFRFKGMELTQAHLTGIKLVIYSPDSNTPGNFIIKEMFSFQILSEDVQEVAFYGSPVIGEVPLNVGFRDFIGFAYAPKDADYSDYYYYYDYWGSISHTWEYDEPQPGLHELYTTKYTELNKGDSIHFEPTGKFTNYNIQLEINNKKYFGSVYEDWEAKRFVLEKNWKNTEMHHYVFPDIKFPADGDVREVDLYCLYPGLVHITVWKPVDNGRYELRGIQHLAMTQTEEHERLVVRPDYVYPATDDVLGIALQLGNNVYSVEFYDESTDSYHTTDYTDGRYGTIKMDKKTTQDAGYSALLHTAFYGNKDENVGLQVDPSTMRIHPDLFFKPVMKLYMFDDSDYEGALAVVGDENPSFVTSPSYPGDELFIYTDVGVTTRGFIVKWHFYAERTGSLQVHVWRYGTDGHLFLVGKNTISVTSETRDIQTFEVREADWLYVESGDILGTSTHASRQRSFLHSDYVYAGDDISMNNCDPCDNMKSSYSRVKMLLKPDDEISRYGHVIDNSVPHLDGIKILPKIAGEMEEVYKVGREYGKTNHGQQLKSKNGGVILTTEPLSETGFITAWRFRQFRAGLFTFGTMEPLDNGDFRLRGVNRVNSAGMVAEQPDDPLVYHVPESDRFEAQSGDVIFVYNDHGSRRGRLWLSQHDDHNDHYKYPHMGIQKEDTVNKGSSLSTGQVLSGGALSNTAWITVGVAAVLDITTAPPVIPLEVGARSRQRTALIIPQNVPYVPTWRTDSSNKIPQTVATPTATFQGAIDYTFWEYISTEREFIVDCDFVNKFKCTSVGNTNFASGVSGSVSCTTLETRNDGCGETPAEFVKDTEYGWYLGRPVDKSSDPSFRPIVSFKFNTDLTPAENLMYFCDCESESDCQYQKNDKHNCKVWIK